MGRIFEKAKIVQVRIKGKGKGKGKIEFVYYLFNLLYNLFFEKTKIFCISQKQQ